MRVFKWIALALLCTPVMLLLFVEFYVAVSRIWNGWLVGSHELNQQFEMMLPEWPPSRDPLDVTELLAPASSIAEVRVKLESALHICENSTSSSGEYVLSCKAYVGYQDGFCSRYQFVVATFDLSSKLKNVMANRQLNCW
jgi:hypothetical protein